MTADPLFMDTTIPPPKKRTQRDYTLGFKLSVVEQVEKGELTYKQAQNRYGIQGRSTVLVWLRKHGKLDWSSSGGRMSNTPETPEQKIKRLERELQDANDLNYLHREMLRQVDHDCGTDYVKKSLSAQQGSRRRKGG
jgi:transposase-like protein